MKSVIIFGIGNMAYTITHYIRKWRLAEIAAYAVDPEYLIRSQFEGRPVIPLDEVLNRFPPDDFDAFVAVGYQDLNEFRLRKYRHFKSMGYRCISVINPDITCLRAGENCLVVPGEDLIEPFVELGENCWVWNGASISHYVRAGSHVWISNGAMIGGSAVIGDRSFFGFGAIVNNGITIGESCLVGSGAIVLKDLASGTAVVSKTTQPIGMDARRVARLFLR